MTVQVPIRSADPYDTYTADRIHDELVAGTTQFALDGWQTVDPLDFETLRRQGLVQRAVLGLFGHTAVSIRLKRLTRGTRKAE